MKHIHFFVLTLSIAVLPTLLQAQSLQAVTTLQAPIVESSGLLRLGERLLTHTDSGGLSAIYEVDSLSGGVSRTVAVIGMGVDNVDWEDMCVDEEYIYLGDFGNNQGDRMNLRIYKVLIDEYLNTPNDTVTASVLQFNYEDQEDFISSEFSTNYDAEAMVSVEDSLYIFTKNWGNSRCNIYSLGKTSPVQTANRIDSLDSQGLVTGADYNPATGELALCGYAFITPFAIQINGIGSGLFSEGEILRTVLTAPSSMSVQIEGIAQWDDRYYLTAESNFTGDPALYRLGIAGPDGLAEPSSQLKVFPNPSQGNIRVPHPHRALSHVFDTQGKVVLTSRKEIIDISSLPVGTYTLRVIDQHEAIIGHVEIIKK